MPRISQRSQYLSANNNSETEESSQELGPDSNRQVSDVVRYIINRAGEHNIFKSADLKKKIKAGSNFQKILKRAISVLETVYGYNMISLDATKVGTKSYIVTNSLPYLPNPVQEKQDLDKDNVVDDVHRILILLILSHIFMSSNTVSEGSLYSFLEAFGIDIDRKHDLFGNVREYIFHTLKAKKYIELQTDPDTKKISFSWGPRSEKEISKHDILNFVCKMYKDRNSAAWINQYKSANEQQLSND